jgi:hypothetical protein
MNDGDRKQQRYEVLIQQGVDRRLNALIEDARKLVDDFLDKGGDRADVGPTQMNNLLGVCGETDSVEAVIGYVQYQIGRDGKRRGWAVASFGEELIRRLEARKKEAEALVSDASRHFQHALEGKSRSEEIDRVWMLLVRQHVGHLRRYFTYKRPKS